MSRRVAGLTPKSAIFLVACLLLAGWVWAKWIARYRAVSQLREDGLLYADHGLINSGAKPPTITSDSAAAIAYLQPTMVTINGSSTITNLNFLAPLRSAELVDIEDCPAIEDVSGLRNLTSLEMLILVDCPGLHSTDVFSRMQRLHHLSLENCPNLRDFQALQQMSSLHHLSLDDCDALTTLDELPALPNLQSLRLQDCKHLRDISSITRFAALDDLDVSGCVELQDISALLSLRTLGSVDLSGCPKIPLAQIRALTLALPNAKVFYLDGRPATDLGPDDTTRPATSQPVSSVEELSYGPTNRTSKTGSACIAKWAAMIPKPRSPFDSTASASGPNGCRLASDEGRSTPSLRRHRRRPFRRAGASGSPRGPAITGTPRPPRPGGELNEKEEWVGEGA